MNALIIDSTETRQAELRKLLQKYGWNVWTSDGNFVLDGEEREVSTVPEVDLCLLHKVNFSAAKRSVFATALSACAHKVMYSGAGLKAKDAPSSDWLCIHRRIMDLHSATKWEWDEFLSWAGAEKGKPPDQVRLLTEPIEQLNLLTALYILCVGFQVAQELPHFWKIPTAERQRIGRQDWWRQPFREFKNPKQPPANPGSSGALGGQLAEEFKNFKQQILNEWDPRASTTGKQSPSDSVLKLVEWIVQIGNGEIDPHQVEAAKAEIGKRLTGV